MRHHAARLSAPFGPVDERRSPMLRPWVPRPHCRFLCVVAPRNRTIPSGARSLADAVAGMGL